MTDDFFCYHNGYFVDVADYITCEKMQDFADSMPLQ